jgi:hypothetical protein
MPSPVSILCALKFRTPPLEDRSMKSNPESERHVFLMERDSALLCRILNLYAARGVAIASAKYAHAAPRTMSLTVETAPMHSSARGVLRILVEKAGTFVGVLEAARMSCTIPS